MTVDLKIEVFMQLGSFVIWFMGFFLKIDKKHVGTRTLSNLLEIDNEERPKIIPAFPLLLYGYNVEF